MSEMEYNKGKLYPVMNKSVEEIADEVVEFLPKYYDSNLEYFTEYTQDFGYVFINKVLYKVDFEVENGDLDEIARAEKGHNGVISFETYHYNGGACWTEVVEGVLKNAQTDRL